MDSPNQAAELIAFNLRHCPVALIQERLALQQQCTARAHLPHVAKEPEPSDLFSRLQKQATQALHGLGGVSRKPATQRDPKPVAPLSSETELVQFAQQTFARDRTLALTALLELKPGAEADAHVLQLAEDHKAVDFAEAYAHNRQGSVSTELQIWLKAQSAQSQHVERAQSLLPAEDWTTMTPERFSSLLPTLLRVHWSQLQPVLDLSSSYLSQDEINAALVVSSLPCLDEQR